MASPLKTSSFTTNGTPGMLKYDVKVKYIVSVGKYSSLTQKVISIILVILFALTCPEGFLLLLLWTSRDFLCPF